MLNKINWSCRFKNKYFWLGLIGVFASSFNINATNIVSAEYLLQELTSLINDPLRLSTFITAIIFAVTLDPTTHGIADSQKALSYIEPKKDWLGVINRL